MNSTRKLTFDILKKAKKQIIIKFIATIIIRAMVMLIPILFGLAVDHISNGKFDQAYIAGVGLILLVIINRVTEIFNTHAWHKFYNKIYNEFSDFAVYNIQNNSLFSLSRISTSEFLNIMNNDINVICEFYCNLPTRIIRVLEFIIIYIYFFMINVYIGMAGVAVSILAFSLLYISSKKIEETNKKRALELDKKTGILHEIFLGIKEIKSFNIFSTISKRSEISTNNYLNSLLTQRVIEDAYKFTIMLIIELFRVGLFIYGIYLITQGKMELAVLLIIYNYYAQLIDNFSDFATINNNYRNLIVSENRYNKILEYSQVKNDDQKISIENCRGLIIFDNILYGYKDNPLLKNISFEIKPNSITAITGASGSGKSGILDLLLKLNRQHTGLITIDNININEYKSDDYYNLIASVRKESTFFNMSIKENLGVIDSNFDNIVRVCKRLGIHEEIIKLKDGYDTILNPETDIVKPMFKHLLAIARVLLKNSKILIFDETFIHLDKKNLDIVISILNRIKQYHTIIIITKEEPVLTIADQILLLNNGEIEKAGTHEELKNNSANYRELIEK